MLRALRFLAIPPPTAPSIIVIIILQQNVESYGGHKIHLLADLQRSHPTPGRAASGECWRFGAQTFPLALWCSNFPAGALVLIPLPRSSCKTRPLSCGMCSQPSPPEGSRRTEGAPRAFCHASSAIEMRRRRVYALSMSRMDKREVSRLFVAPLSCPCDSCSERTLRLRITGVVYSCACGGHCPCRCNRSFSIVSVDSSAAVAVTDDSSATAGAAESAVAAESFALPQL